MPEIGLNNIIRTYLWYDRFVSALCLALFKSRLNVYMMNVFQKISRLFLSTCLCVGIVSCGSAKDDNTVVKDISIGEHLPGKHGEAIAFIGEKVFIESAPKETTSRKVSLPDGQIREHILIPGPMRYEARYRVLDWISKPIDATVVNFDIHYPHGPYYGEPVPGHEKALLLLENHHGRWQHAFNDIHDVSETTTGDWAICGPPLANYGDRDDVKNYMTALDFQEPIKGKAGIDCTIGTLATDIYRYYSDYRFLPLQRRLACNTELGFPWNYIPRTLKGEKAQEDMLKQDACIERLKLVEASSQN